MSDLKFNLTNSDGKALAAAARKIAMQFDPFGSMMPKIIAFILGCVFMASLDYGDVWICVGQCDVKFAELKGEK